MKLSVLVIVILLVVRLDLNFTPLRESYPFEHDFKDEKDFFTYSSWQLIKHFVMRLNPWSQKVDHRPAYFHAISVEDVNSLIEKEVENFIVVLATFRRFERVCIAANGLLHGNTPLTHVVD